MTSPITSFKLDRPLVVFDLETTGVEVATARIVEIAVIRHEVDGSVRQWSRRINPQMPIPEEVTAVHGISDTDVEHCPVFKDVVSEVKLLFEDAVVLGYNQVDYDIPVLLAEVRRALDHMEIDPQDTIDVFKIYRNLLPHTLEIAVLFYLNRAHDGAHGAVSDARATLDVFCAQVGWHPSLPAGLPLTELLPVARQAQRPANSYDENGKIRVNAQGELYLSFGTHSGKTLRELATTQRGYLSWMLKNMDDPRILSAVRTALEGK